MNTEIRIISTRDSPEPPDDGTLGVEEVVTSGVVVGEGGIAQIPPFIAPVVQKLKYVTAFEIGKPPANRIVPATDMLNKLVILDFNDVVVHELVETS